MQLLESSLFGVRSARHRLESTESKISVTLFPMLHVGETSFYERVFQDASKHDVVLLEGIKSPITRRLTRSYRWIEKSDLGLIVQPKYKNSSSEQTVVHADLSAKEFEGEWAKTPFYIRVLLYGGSIYLGAKNRWFASRESLAKGRSINDLKSRDEIFRWDAEFAAVGNALLKARDERLIECLQIQLNKFQTKGCRIAIIYGASHIAAVLRELRKNGNYRSVESEWLTVFNL